MTQRSVEEFGADAAWPATLVDALPVGVAQVDGHGRVVRANAYCLTLLGLPAGYLGFDLHELAWPRWAADVQTDTPTILDRMLDGHAVDGIFTFPAAAASVGPGSVGPGSELRIRAVPSFEDGAVAGGCIAVVDVPARVAYQHSVGQQAEAYQVLAEHLADMVFTVEGGVITWASPSVQLQLGYEPSALLGSPAIRLIHPDDPLSPTLEPQRRSNAVRHRLRTADGRYRWFDTVVTARFAPDGTEIARYGMARDIDEHVRLEQQIFESERRFREALDASPDGFAIYRAERSSGGTAGRPGRVIGLRLVSMNTVGAAGFGVDVAALVGRDLLDFYPQGAENGLWRDMVAALESGEMQRTRVSEVSGDWSGVLDGVQVRLDADTVMSTWRDVTDAVRGEELLARAYEETAEVRATLQTALDATSDGFIVFELDRDDEGAVTGMRAVHANAAAAGETMTPEETLGRDPRDIFPRFVSSGLWDKTLAAVTQMSPREHRVHHRGDAGQWTSSVDVTIAPVGSDRVVLTLRDVTVDERERRHHATARREAEHAALHDPLTGLPNRVLLHERLEEALRACRSDEQVAVVYCDLDGFKAVNDTYGHAAGDAVLTATARRLELLLRRQDTAARLAGDEFVMVLRHVSATWTADAFLARASRQLSEPVWVDGTLLAPSASLGIVLAHPNDGRPTERAADALLAAADHAMYLAKAAREVPLPS